VWPGAGAESTAPRRLSRPLQYLVAVAAVGVATATHWALHPHLNHDVRLTIFALAVVAGAWVGGVGPGLLATALSIAAAMPLSLRPGSVVTITSSSYFVRFILFGLLGAAVSVFSELRRTTQARIEASDETAAAELRARRDAEERYRRIVETAIEGVWEVDAEGRTLYANRRLEEMLGYGPGELAGAKLVDLLALDSVERGRAEWEARTRGAVAAEGVGYEFARKDGSTIWVQCTSTPVRDAEGRFAGAIAMLTDVTARRAAERALRATEARRSTELAVVRVLARAGSLEDTYPRILEAIGEGLDWDLGAAWFVDSDANALRCRAVWRREGVGPATASHDMKATFAPGVDLPGRVWIAGEPAWVSELAGDANFSRTGPAAADGLASGFAFPLLAGASCIGALEFFSRRRRDPDPDLLEGAAALGSQVGHFIHARLGDDERGRLLDREQQARQEAEAANRAKDEFLATLSHELRTPLNAIVGWAHLLRTGQLDAPSTTRAVEVIDRNARAQSQIIADVLDVSKIVMGKLKLQAAPVAVVPIVQGALEGVRAAADAKGVRIETAFDPADAYVSGDADRLRQVVWNLLSNAVKFTPPGGRALVQVRGMGTHVEVRVEDDGAGIEPEFLPHVFERFRQSDQSSTRRFGGLGLGLALVRHLVELHGGSVSATSSGPNTGAAFVIRLPLMVRPVDTAEPEARAAPAPVPGPVPALPSTTADAPGVIPPRRES
jgi:PAS domain S-box-containing protein